MRLEHSAAGTPRQEPGGSNSCRRRSSSRRRGELAHGLRWSEISGREHPRTKEVVWAPRRRAMDAQASPHRDDPPVPARLRAIDGLVRAATSWLALTLAIAVAPALAVWPLLHFDEIEFVLENKLDSDLRVDILEAMAL